MLLRPVSVQFLSFFVFPKSISGAGPRPPRPYTEFDWNWLGERERKSRGKQRTVETGRETPGREGELASFNREPSPSPSRAYDTPTPSLPSWPFRGSYDAQRDKTIETAQLWCRWERSVGERFFLEIVAYFCWTNSSRWDKFKFFEILKTTQIILFSIWKFNLNCIDINHEIIHINNEMGNIDLIIICREKAKSNTIVYFNASFCGKTCIWC